jgi:hypothetical protein
VEWDAPFILLYCGEERRRKLRQRTYYDENLHYEASKQMVALRLNR